MRHSLQQLFDAAYRYYPRNSAFPATDLNASAEYRNQQEAFRNAGGGYGTWRDMIARLAAKFPEAQFPGVVLENRVPFLKPPTGDTPWSLCYQGCFWFLNRPGESIHWLGFFVSFVVPYYAVYSIRELQDPERKGEILSFEPSPEEEPFAAALKAEIESTYPDHELMPADVGMTLVPEIDAYGHGPNKKATIFDCLFTDRW